MRHPRKQVGHSARVSLAAIAAGGQAQEYLGKQVMVAEVEELLEEEIAKLYQRYEPWLGTTMTKTLGSSLLQMYALTTSRLLSIPPESQVGLVEDLESDPFLMHALTTACCELYRCYGMYLAPLTILPTTARHCRFEPEKNGIISKADYGESSGNPCLGWDAVSASMSEPREGDCMPEGP